MTAPLCVSIPVGESVVVDQVFQFCIVTIYGSDVSLSMDGLSIYHDFRLFL